MSGEPEGVPIEDYHGPLPTSPSNRADDKQDEAATYPPSPPSRWRIWLRRIFYPFFDADLSVSWAKQSGLWVALSGILLSLDGWMAYKWGAFFYLVPACLWILLAIPVFLGFVSMMCSLSNLHHSHKRLLVLSLNILSLAMTVGLILAAIQISKMDNLFGELTECCCWTCEVAALQWYNQH